MKNKGISLITLVITIVVIIILAAAIILALGNNNPINQARVATITSTKDNVESSILTYSSSIKAKTLGEFSTEEILITNDSYKIVIPGSTANITVDGNSKTLYKINTSEAKSKLNMDLKEETNGAWYIDKNGKTYLVYVNKPSIPSYLIENDEVLSSIRGFVTYADAVIETPTNPTNPNTPQEQPINAGKVSENISDFIGKYVTNYVSENGYDKWKIFYADENNVYLITENNIEVSLLNGQHGFNIYGSNYKVSANSRNALLNSLDNAETFKKFKDTNGLAINAIIPTIQDFCNSFNSVPHAEGKAQKVYWADNGIHGGYDISLTTPVAAKSYSLSGLDTEEYDHLWMIDDSDRDTNGYWLKSPSSYGTDYVIVIKGGGLIQHGGYNNSRHSGIRPMVVLNSNCTFTKNEDTEGNITYEVNLPAEKYKAKDFNKMSEKDKYDKFMGAEVTDYISKKDTNHDIKWRIFYADDSNVYLISKYYVPTSMLSEGHGFSILSDNKVYMPNTNTRDDFLNALKRSETYLGFKDLQGKALEVRIPTVEDFCNAYNSIPHFGTNPGNHDGTGSITQKVYYTYSGDTMNVGITNPVQSSDIGWSGYTLPRGELEDLWTIYPPDQANHVQGYWLTSASAKNTWGVFVGDTNGGIDFAGYYSNNLGYGLRPIVILKPDTVFTKHVDENGKITYTIND